MHTGAHTGSPDEAVGHATRLLNQFPYGTAEFEEACRALSGAANQGNARAHLMLGHVFVRNGAMPEAAHNARVHFSRAHEAGVPEATERLADLHLSGRLGNADATALALYEARAQAADAPALCNLAYLKGLSELPASDQIAATQLYVRAAMQGYTLAFQALGIRLLHGWGCQPDVEEGLAWLSLSKVRQFPLASRLVTGWEAQLDSNTREAVAGRAEALKDAIRQLGSTIAELQTKVGQSSDFSLHFQQAIDLAVDHTMSIEPRDAGPPGRKPHAEQRCDTPRVLSADGFADELAMAHLMDAALPELKSPSQVAALRGGTEVDAFDGSAAMFSPSFSTPVMHIMQRRFAELLERDVRCFEPMSVLHYGPGHAYTTHVDYFSEDRIAEHEKIGDNGGQREVTCLIYLTAPTDGGVTHYPSAAFDVAGKPGMAVIHYNVGSDGNPDPHSLHAGTPIVAGDKWLARTAIRAARLY